VVDSQRQHFAREETELVAGLVPSGNRQSTVSPSLFDVEETSKTHLTRLRHLRWYGFWNFGDVMHTYDSYRHVWRYDVGGELAGEEIGEGRVDPFLSFQPLSSPLSHGTDIPLLTLPRAGYACKTTSSYERAGTTSLTRRFLSQGTTPSWEPISGSGLHSSELGDLMSSESLMQYV